MTTIWSYIVQLIAAPRLMISLFHDAVKLCSHQININLTHQYLIMPYQYLVVQTAHT